MLNRLKMTLPIVQAPMAGVSTPTLAATVSNAGGLGSIGVGATDANGARAMIEETRARIDRIDGAFNVNLFVHGSATADPERERAWLEWLAPLFAEFDAEPPKALRTIYKSFADDADMLETLLALKPPVVSFHFGLPSADALSALRARDLPAGDCHQLGGSARDRRGRYRWYRGARYRGWRTPGRLRSGKSRRCSRDVGPDALAGTENKAPCYRCRRDHGWGGHRSRTRPWRGCSATRHGFCTLSGIRC